MKIALAQTNPKVGDLKGNAEKIISFVKKAEEQGAQLVIFSELVLTGYPPRDLLEFNSFIEDNIKQLNEIKKYSENIAILLGYVEYATESDGKRLHNACALLHKGKIITKYCKHLLPTYDVFDETRYFEEGQAFSVVDLFGKKVGLTICEDIWNDKSIVKKPLYRQNPVDILEENGAEIIVNLSASPYHLYKELERFNIVQTLSKKYKIPFVYVNQVGGNDDLLFDGMSFAVDKEGEIKALCKGFEEDLVIFDTENNEGIIVPASKCIEDTIVKALTMGLKDYCDKMGFKKVVIGLSGGIDSALTAVLAANALGAENVLGITMPSMYSSTGSISDSEILAQNLGIECKTIPITPMFNCFKSNLSDFNELKMDLAEENLQARLRANILMMYSNRYGYMLLSTGNKSEMSVGYCTLYGDMAGGLNLLSDLPKVMVYKVSRYINKDKEIIPWDIIEKPPSAELRPDQKDQDSLPPYELLDDVLTDYIEKHKTADEISQKYPKPVVDDIIKKINNSEYKRNQATLGLKITTRAFGSGRRFPIVQGYDFRIG